MEKSERFSPENRWSEKLIEGSGWTPVPNFLLRNIHLIKDEAGNCINPTQVLLIILLASYKWDERLPYPTVGTLATQMGLGERSVRAALKVLEDRKLISRLKSHNGGPNRYDLKPLIEKLETLKDDSNQLNVNVLKEININE